jgi:hypothetical protein
LRLGAWIFRTFFSIQILIGFFMAFICSPSSLFTLYSIQTYYKSFTFSNQSFSTLHPPFNSHVSHPSVERIISLKSCQFQANLLFWMSHFHSNSSAKKHNLRNKKTTFKKPIKEQQILTETIRFSDNKINKKKNCQKHQWKFS